MSLAVTSHMLGYSILKIIHKTEKLGFILNYKFTYQEYTGQTNTLSEYISTKCQTVQEIYSSNSTKNKQAALGYMNNTRTLVHIQWTTKAI